MTENEMRELDAWIAEHVMGLRRVSCLRDFCSGTFITNTDADCLVFDGKNSTWKPTTDYAAALMVLEKCADETEEIECIYFGKVGDSFIIGIEPLKIEVEAKSLPLAFCLFAQHLFTKPK